MIAWRRIRLLIIDLDNTLCDTYHSLTLRQWRKVADMFEREGRPDLARRFRSRAGKQSFVSMLAGLTAAERRRAIRTYDENPVTTLTLFADAHGLLRAPQAKVLLSRGAPALQRRKIRHLGIASHFDHIAIVGTFRDKTGALRSILRRYKVAPSEALVIGDRIEEEIKDAKKLGIPAVLVKRKDLPQPRSKVRPDLTVRSLETVTKRLRVNL